MAGHSKWKQIKNKKAATDQKRGQLFTKLLNGIRVAAREDPNPEFNPRLKAAIAKAKEENVPGDNIERAISQAKEGVTEELLLEAYGPAGLPIIITAATDNKNRTVAEIKKILSENGGKLATPGSVLWAFEKTPEGEWRAKFPKETGEQVASLIEALENQPDVINTYSNSS